MTIPAAAFDPTRYKDPALVARLRARIHALMDEIGRPVKLMHICGTHEHEIGRYALRELFPDALTVLAGPGCPVCVCDAALIDAAITLARTPNVLLASFGDMLAVPGSLPLEGERKGDVRMSLLDARAQGGEVRVVYSAFDAAKLAAKHPDQDVVFFSVGFETTVVAVAAMLRRGVPDNLSILEANYYTPPATGLLPELDGFDVDGFILPGHAGAITGWRLYEHLPRRGLACAVGGFEPVDIMAAVASLLRQLRDGRCTVENTYRRLVKPAGNERAKRELFEVFELAPMRWRGIADIPASGFKLREAYRRHSASARFAAQLASLPRGREHAGGCRCAEVTLGQLQPAECPLFAKRCTPENPYGPCMVSHEGTCRAWHLYGMHRKGLDVEV